MTVESVTMRVPQTLYAMLQDRAERTHRSVEEALAEALEETAPLDDTHLPADVAASVAILDTMPDDALWATARTSHLSSAAAAHLEELTYKRQREGLDAEEQRITETLLHQYERAMLVRAEAMVRLKERGHDISPLLVQIMT